MHCTSFFILLLSLLGITASAPTKANMATPAKAMPTHIAPSTCATYYPSVLRQLVEAEPDVVHANTANETEFFRVTQSISFADDVKFDRVHQHVVFDNIATGSWDCQLMVSWPQKVHVNTASKSGSYASTGVSLDVYSASYNSSAFVGSSKPKGADVGAADQGPFASWESMMAAVVRPGTNDLSVKGDREKMQDRTPATSAKLTYFSTVRVSPGEYGMTINSEACPQQSNGTLEFLFEIPSTDGRNANVEFLGSEEKGAGIYLLANC